jgi:hypothetical protein
MLCLIVYIVTGSALLEPASGSGHMASQGNEGTFVRVGRFVWASQDCKNTNSEAIVVNEHVQSERSSARESKTFLRYD